MRVDLHMHSTVSDGSLSVRDLVEIVHEAGISVFALTDHDTVDGLAEARAEARRHGMELVNGVEISTRVGSLELHILGYGFDPAHPGLLDQLRNQQRARRERIPAIVAKLGSLGVPLEVEDVLAVAGSSNPGRPHVAKALLARGLVATMEEAFRAYLHSDAPSYVPKPLPSAAEAIAWIHGAGGKAVWAHPQGRSLHRPGGVALLARELRAAGLDGIEVVHPSHDDPTRRRLRRLARELELVPTGGSDFHGMPPSGGPPPALGRNWVEASALEALFA